MDDPRDIRPVVPPGRGQIANLSGANERVPAGAGASGAAPLSGSDLRLPGVLTGLPQAAAAAEQPRERRLAGVRVLIVDDDRDIGEVLQFVLEGQGALVSVAVSAAEALTAMSRTLPDVLLTDIAMPGGSGYDLMRLLTAREGMNTPPAAALSAYAPGQDLQEALAAGFRMLLEKPIDPHTLISAVATLAVEARGKAPTQLLVERAHVD